MATARTRASVTATATTTTAATLTLTLASAPLYPHTPDTGAPTDALAVQGDKGSRFRAYKSEKGKQRRWPPGGVRWCVGYVLQQQGH